MKHGSVLSIFLSVMLLPGSVTAGEMEDLQHQTEAMDNQDGQVVVDKLTKTFTGFSGSEDNAYALVTGLRDGGSVTMSTESGGETTTAAFTDPTGQSGYGNVFISLSLARAQLEAAGITEPTVEQIELALMGGKLNAETTLAGILALRQQKMSWGQIAQSLDIRLGTVISEMRMVNSDIHSASMIGRANKSESVPQRSVRLRRPQRLSR